MLLELDSLAVTTNNKMIAAGYVRFIKKLSVVLSALSAERDRDCFVIDQSHEQICFLLQISAGSNRRHRSIRNSGG